ncbi:MAG: hypothetical protein FWG25_05160, partial [Promicromonosporaceae bacterium]|nr:hypothetical protein [Promicromonosporaceae bacterium]
MTILELLLLAVAFAAVVGAIVVVAKRSQNPDAEPTAIAPESALNPRAAPNPTAEKVVSVAKSASFDRNHLFGAGETRWWQHQATEVVVTVAFALFAALLAGSPGIAGPLAGMSASGFGWLARFWSVLMILPLAIRRKYPVESTATVAV